MFPVETVMVKQRVQAGVNVIGEEIWDEKTQEVDGVLVAPGNTADLAGNIRPDGVRIDFTLYFPSTFTASLRGATVTVRGIACRVVGDPQQYLDTPGHWNRVVQVEVTHG